MNSTKQFIYIEIRKDWNTELKEKVFTERFGRSKINKYSKPHKSNMVYYLPKNASKAFEEGSCILEEILQDAKKNVLE